jgi:2-polyprenyl-6-methoxyphenol hydroxylase-like FAD-dependent oxidoreductase
MSSLYVTSTSGNSSNPRQSSIYNVWVGGSLGGLTTGLALKAQGHNTTILERNPSPLLQNQGADIVAGGDTLAFNKYDRCKRLIAVTSQKRMYQDKSGKVVHEENMKQNMTSWDLSYYLLRANFDGMKGGYCQVPEKGEGDGVARYEYDHVVAGLEEGEEVGVKVVFRNHSGTDGPNSTVHKSSTRKCNVSLWATAP